MVLVTPKYQKFGALTIGERQRLYAALEFDRQTREVAKFAVGDVIETPMGLYEINRSYNRGHSYINDKWTGGWRYECLPVSSKLPGFPAYRRRWAWRTFREDELVAWNPLGVLVEPAVFVVPPIPPIVRPKLLTGNTMNTPLLPAWSSDVRVIASHFLAKISTEKGIG
jgi:hypothetical protein